MMEVPWKYRDPKTKHLYVGVRDSSDPSVMVLVVLDTEATSGRSGVGAEGMAAGYVAKHGMYIPRGDIKNHINDDPKGLWDFVIRCWNRRVRYGSRKELEAWRRADRGER